MGLLTYELSRSSDPFAGDSSPITRRQSLGHYKSWNSDSVNIFVDISEAEAAASCKNERLKDMEDSKKHPSPRVRYQARGD